MRKFGNQDLPVSALVIGSSRPPVGASIVSVNHPTNALIDDVVPVKSKLQLNGLKGRMVRAKLMADNSVIDEKTISVQLDQLTTTVELVHTPKKEGIKKFTVKIEPIDADEKETAAFANNSSRNFSIAVSDNMTEILVIEGRPRWEYNYIRNIFASRDATVQLQVVLAEPDRVAERQRPSTYASATREAHEIEATFLPKDEAEWLKFDVILIGDVPPGFINDSQIGYLKNFVRKRAGTLIFVAGQQSLPHRFANSSLAELFPATFKPVNGVTFKGPEKSFRFAITANGLRHSILRQADSLEESNKIWNSIPELYWRHAVTETKPGATVLAYASHPAIAQQLDAARIAAKAPDADPDKYIELKSKLEQQNALMISQRIGAGKVLMLNTDRTWRFRYQIGDTYHHRFWGQILRWASADKLQAGNEYVQIGSDKSDYKNTEPIIITTKITDTYFAPVNDPEAKVKIFRGDQLVVAKKLTRPGEAPGTYRVDLGKLSEPGQYRVELDSPAAKQIFSGSENGMVSTEFTVAKPQTQSLEMINLTADREGLTRLTSLAGGAMIEPVNRFDVLNYFNEGTRRYTEQKRYPLWDSWPMLALLIGFVATEWMLRKKGGLV